MKRADWHRRKPCSGLEEACIKTAMDGYFLASLYNERLVKELKVSAGLRRDLSLTLKALNASQAISA
jgi:hypothetical protein